MKKVIVISVIALFICIGFQPAFAVEPKSSNDIIENAVEDIEPKDYLFDTIIVIANNPEVKELFEEYGNNIYDLDYNYKGILLKILFNNPKLLFSKLFTKPKITSDYLNSVFNEGCEIVDIIGEDKALEMVKSVKFTNPDIVDDLHNIVLNDDELSNRISILEELNEESWEDTPIICAISALILIRFVIRCYFFMELSDIFYENPELSSLFEALAIFYSALGLVGLWLVVILGCMY